MMAYPKAFMEAITISRIVHQWEKKQLITSDIAKEIIKLYEHSFYSPNIFIRILLFIFTLILISAVAGFIALAFTFDGLEQTGIGVLMILYAGIILFVLENIIIKDHKAYRAGLDDGFLYTALGYMIGGIIMIIQVNSDNPQELLLLLLCFPILLIFAIRYVDMLISALTFACLLAILFVGLSEMGPVIKSFLPFGGMLISAGIYLWIKKLKQQPKFDWWMECLLIVEIMALFTFYMSGNYFVVRELTEIMFSTSFNSNSDIPFAFIFYAFTIIVPFLYVWLAILKKDRIMLRAGLLIFALSVLTFKFYFSLGHSEITLTISGILMIAIAWGVMQWLKKPKHGLTTKEDAEENLFTHSELENIIISESFEGNIVTESKPELMAGGGFGGGGASGEF